jgi:hypothetical protein
MLEDKPEDEISETFDDYERAFEDREKILDTNEY